MPPPFDSILDNSALSLELRKDFSSAEKREATLLHDCLLGESMHECC